MSMKKEVIIRGEAVEVDKIIQENRIRKEMGLITMTERPFAPEKAEAARPEKAEAARPEKGKPQKDSKYKD